MDKQQLQAALTTAGRVLTSTLDLDAVLEELILEIKILLEATGGSVLLLDPASDKLVFAAVVAPDARALIGVRLPPTAGIAGWTIQQRQPVLVDDAQNDPRFYNQIDNLTGLTTHSLLAVPLIFKERAIGVIEIINKANGHFNRQDLEILETLAGSAAIAIENARLYEELERRAQHLAVLHEMDRAITASLRLGDVYHVFSLHAARLFPYDWLSIAQLDGAEIRFNYVAGEIKNSLPPQTVLPRKTSAVGWVMSRGQPMLRHDLTPDTGFADDEQLVALGIRSNLIIPLRVKGRIIGTWELGSRQLGAYHADDLELLQAMADQLAIAIENARLFEQVQSGREQLRRLAQQVVSAQEEERQRLSRELHDEAGQVLTALKIGLTLIRDDLPAPMDTLRQRMGEAVTLTDTTMERLRTLARDLRPPALDTAGLIPTLEGLCHEFAQRVHLAIEFEAEELPALPDLVNICLYRFLQEALTNVAKHAQATQVGVKLSAGASAVSLMVRDNGQGFDLQTWPQPTGIGLLGLRERLDLLGGRLEIESQPGQGACLRAYLPWEEN
ncbi:MAG: GAF domain-containing sensor histidine kinase [Chloroflexi bacterium]|nr:GAF domain-containing sensor histidine kinase [Chloroflexota bacterium]